MIEYVQRQPESRRRTRSRLPGVPNSGVRDSYSAVKVRSAAAESLGVPLDLDRPDALNGRRRGSAGRALPSRASTRET